MGVLKTANGSTAVIPMLEYQAAPKIKTEKMSLKRLFISAALICANFTVVMSNDNEGYVEKYDGWENVINAIIQVESKGNPNAYNKNGDCVGILQITRICVKEANNILKDAKSEIVFSLSDRWDVEKSKKIFILIQNKYNPEHDLIKACRIWNEGPYYNKQIKTTEYVKKVLQYLNK